VQVLLNVASACEAQGTANGCAAAAASGRAFAKATASAHASALAVALSKCNCGSDALAIAEGSASVWQQEFSSEVAGEVFAEVCVDTVGSGKAKASAETLLLCVEEKYAYMQAKVWHPAGETGEVYTQRRDMFKVASRDHEQPHHQRHCCSVCFVEH
jgi:hypothetical protein